MLNLMKKAFVKIFFVFLKTIKQVLGHNDINLFMRRNKGRQRLLHQNGLLVNSCVPS